MLNKAKPDNCKFLNKYFQKIILPIVILSFFFQGCISVNSQFKGLEPSARPIPADTVKDYVKLSDAEIMRSSFRLFWFIPVTPQPNIIDAINDTIISKSGDNLIEMQTWHERQYWILGTVDIIRVKGIVIQYKTE